MPPMIVICGCQARIEVAQTKTNARRGYGRYLRMMRRLESPSCKMCRYAPMARTGKDARAKARRMRVSRQKLQWTRWDG
jgi:hypothetical protein